jgi:hypothetical protein
MSTALVFAVFGLAAGICLTDAPTPRVTVAADDAGDPRLAEIQADIKTLKDKAVDQAHVMVSVAYHFNNLWFAGKAGNWALAEFYWNETRSHLRWGVRVIPIRKDNAGREVNLPGILEAMENTPLAQLKEAIAGQDASKFEAAYKLSLETCYACHKAADKPFLRPQMPERPAEPMMNFDPAVKWPL